MNDKDPHFLDFLGPNLSTHSLVSSSRQSWVNIVSYISVRPLFNLLVRVKDIFWPQYVSCTNKYKWNILAYKFSSFVWRWWFRFGLYYGTLDKKKNIPSRSGQTQSSERSLSQAISRKEDVWIAWCIFLKMPRKTSSLDWVNDCWSGKMDEEDGWRMKGMMPWDGISLGISLYVLSRLKTH